MTDSLLRGAVGTLMLKIGVVGLAFLNQMLAARWMGEAEFGTYAYVLAWYGVLGVVARFGTDSLMIRLTAAAVANRRWGELRGVLRFGFGVVGLSGGGLILICALLLALFPQWSSGARVQVAGYGLPMLLIAAWLSTCQALLYGFKRPWQSQLLEAQSRLLALPLMALLFWLHGELSATVGMTCVLFSTMSALLFGARWVRSAMPRDSRSVPAEVACRPWIGAAWPLFILASVRTLANQSDLLLVGVLIEDPAVAGFYIVALRIADLASFGLQAVNNSLAPVIAELHSQNRRAELQAQVAKAAYAITGFCLCVALGLVMLGEPLLTLFGEGFSAAYWPLIILTAGQAVNATTGSVGYLMTMTGHQGEAARISVVSSLIGTALSLWLIPRYGLIGAAAANASAMILVNLAMLVFVLLRLKINPTVFQRFPLRAA